ncbi:MAG TPA: hypothetical protein ENH20_01350 [Candidatus Pacearchaeota archaeon]|nr:hypothetical protein [Candidatus Pacearchaeota archaeon]
MEMIHVGKTDFGRILRTAEILIEDVEQVFQDEAVKERVEDVVEGRITGKTQKDYNEYLKRRGIESQVS